MIRARIMVLVIFYVLVLVGLSVWIFEATEPPVNLPLRTRPPR